MKIEVGRTYKTKSGAIVKIVADYGGTGLVDFPFVGVKADSGNLSRYSETGAGAWDENTIVSEHLQIELPKFQWLAMNSAGDWWLHISKPVPGGSLWISSGATFCLGDGILSCDDWMKSLHRVLEGGVLERVEEVVPAPDFCVIDPGKVEAVNAQGKVIK